MVENIAAVTFRLSSSSKKVGSVFLCMDGIISVKGLRTRSDQFRLLVWRFSRFKIRLPQDNYLFCVVFVYK